VLYELTLREFALINGPFIPSGRFCSARLNLAEETLDSCSPSSFIKTPPLDILGCGRGPHLPAVCTVFPCPFSFSCLTPTLLFSSSTSFFFLSVLFGWPERSFPSLVKFPGMSPPFFFCSFPLPAYCEAQLYPSLRSHRRHLHSLLRQSGTPASTLPISPTDFFSHSSFLRSSLQWALESVHNVTSSAAKVTGPEVLLCHGRLPMPHLYPPFFSLGRYPRLVGLPLLPLDRQNFLTLGFSLLFPCFRFETVLRSF